MQLPHIHATFANVSFLRRQWYRGSRTRAELQRYVSQRVEEAADGDELDAAIRRERIIDLAAGTHGLCNVAEVCLREVMKWKEKAMTAQQEQHELSERVRELETAASLPSASPPQPLSSPAAARLKRTAAAADLPPALPPFVRRIKRMDAECQTTLPRLEDKEMQTDEEEMAPALQAPPPCPRCSDLEQQLTKSQRKVAALDSQLSRMKERDKRSPCFYNVYDGRSWVTVQRAEETESDAEAEGEEQMAAAPVGEQKTSESAFRPIGITEEAEPGAEQMQTSETEYKQAGPAISAIGMVSPDAAPRFSDAEGDPPEQLAHQSAGSDPSPPAMEVATIMAAAAAVSITVAGADLQAAAVASPSAFQPVQMQLSPDPVPFAAVSSTSSRLGQSASAEESKEEPSPATAAAPSSAIASSPPVSPLTFLGESLQSYLSRRRLDDTAAHPRLAEETERYREMQLQLRAQEEERQRKA